MAVLELLQKTRKAARILRTSDIAQRNEALSYAADALTDRRAAILEANERDLAAASGLSSALRDRLQLSDRRIEAMIRSVRDVAAQPDPLDEGRVVGAGRDGFKVTRRRIPLGVIAVVYEARPNVTAECATLAVKSGNGIVLRGGKEALNSNVAVAAAMTAGITAAGLPEDVIRLITDLDRAVVAELLGAVGSVDLVIPRGGAGLMAMVDEHAKVPVIRHGQGICHVYVDASANLEMAAKIAENAKVQRPSVCNAMETLLVHVDKAVPLLSQLGPRLHARGVELRADGRARAALHAAGVSAAPAQATDWDTEFSDLVLAVRVVDGLDEALDHIEDHGTHHTAAIVAENAEAAERFLSTVDASCVLWNASTRYNDGGELGLGAEIGISTSKMHAYGPMSAIDLTAEKLVVYGTGQVRG